MARKRRKSKAKATPLRMWVLLVLLGAVGIAGVVAVKWLRTTPGTVFLLDHGLVAYYSTLQETLDPELRRVIGRLQAAEEMTEESVTIAAGNRRLVARKWRSKCDAPCSILLVNLAVTKMVRRIGGVVRSSTESDGGHRLVIEVGSNKYTTHRLEIRRSAEPVEPLAKEDRPQLALVIDDFGYSRSRLAESFLRLDLPLTIAVIPELRHSQWAVSNAVASRKQAILHLPMEAEEHPPDARTVAVAMRDDDIAALVDGYLDTNPRIIGVNNHQGSLATQDERVMTAVIGVIKNRGLFFLDSLTSSKSIAYNTARELGVRTARNDLFLDGDTEDPDVVEDRLYQLVNIARRRGVAVGIGHPKRWTLEAIERNEQFLKSAGVELVFLSEVVE